MAAMAGYLAGIWLVMSWLRCLFMAAGAGIVRRLIGWLTVAAGWLASRRYWRRGGLPRRFRRGVLIMAILSVSFVGGVTARGDILMTSIVGSTLFTWPLGSG